MTRLRGTRLKLVIALALGCVVGVFGLGAFAGARLTRDCSFSRETWAAGREPVQHAILERDLRIVLDCGTLDGASRARVEQLLGRPDDTSATVWSYDVGVPELLSDYPDLEVRFGDDGLVENARVPGYTD